MEETQFAEANIVREGVNPSDAQYVSPPVALAEAGLEVDFSMHVNPPTDEDENDPDA